MSEPRWGTAHLPPIEVVFGADGFIDLEHDGDAPARLSPESVSHFFADGVRYGPKLTGGRTEGALTLASGGEVQFLVGALDLGTELGLIAVAYGMERALDRAVHVDNPEPAPGDDQSDGSDTWTPSGAASDDDQPFADDAFVEVSHFDVDIDWRLQLVERGTRITLTDHGHPAAVVLPWQWYRQRNERDARAKAAYWGSWVGGRFDPAAYVAAIDDLVTPPGGLSTQMRREQEADVS